MLKFKFKSTLILGALICINPIYAKVIIWDLGDTLLKADHFKLAGQIGIGNLFLHALMDWKNPVDIKDQVFDVLNLMEKDDERKFIPKYQDKDLPEVMCKWLEGKKDGLQIFKTTQEFINASEDKNLFVSKRHKKVIKNSVKAMFNPKVLANNLKPIKSVVKLLEKCAKNKHKIIIFSNFDKNTFNYLKKNRKNRRLFKNIKDENIIISGKIGLLKPDPKAYQYIIDKYNLDPKDCIMIDDQVENIDAANKFGMTGIVFKDAKKLKKELKSKKLI